MGVYFEKKFWLDTSERVIATFAEVLGAFLIAGATFADVDWATAASISGVAALASLLKCVAAQRVGDDSPSLIG